MLTAAPYVDGFDPSAPMQFHSSNAGVLIAIVGVAAVLAVGGTALATTSSGGSLRDAINSRVGVVAVLGALAIAAVTIPASPVAPARFDACHEASRWADARYDIQLTDLDCENLFEHEGWFDNGTSEALLDSGTVIRSKETGGKTILADQTGQELPHRQSLSG